MDVDPAMIDSREAIRSWEGLAAKALGPCPPGVAEMWIEVPLPDGWISHTRLVCPLPEQGESIECPLVVYFHGGGFSYSGPDQVLLPARAYAHHFRVVVACPSYKFCPENPFPAPVHTAWEICAWLSDVENLNDGPLHGTGITVDPALGFVVGGLSAGASMAAVVAGIQALAADEDSEIMRGLTSLEAPVTALFLGIPALVQEAQLPTLGEPYKSLFRSRVDNAEGGGKGLLKTKDIREIERNLQADWHSPWWSAMNSDFSDAEVRARYPAKVFLHAGDLDPLRDDAIIYERWLRDNQIAETRLVLHQGVGHASWVTAHYRGVQRPKMRKTSLDGMAWLLGRTWDDSQGTY